MRPQPYNDAAYKGFSRGFNNNNPLNLRLTNITWIGKVPNTQNIDKSFEQFTTLGYGVRAAVKNMATYLRQGWNTPNSIIDHWAPASDNNGSNANYKAHVIDSVGPQPITYGSDRFVDLIASMAVFENGGLPNGLSKDVLKSMIKDYL